MSLRSHTIQAKLSWLQDITYEDLEHCHKEGIDLSRARRECAAIAAMIEGLPPLEEQAVPPARFPTTHSTNPAPPPLSLQTTAESVNGKLTCREDPIRGAHSYKVYQENSRLGGRTLLYCERCGKTLSVGPCVRKDGKE